MVRRVSCRVLGLVMGKVLVRVLGMVLGKVLDRVFGMIGIFKCVYTLHPTYGNV